MISIPVMKTVLIISVQVAFGSQRVLHTVGTTSSFIESEAQCVKFTTEISNAESRCPLNAFSSKPAHVVFEVGRLALRQVFYEYFGFPLPVSFH
jgi:hypothetical protein